MRATQNIFRVRRQYNKWVGNQTLEDYALRFTATKSRRWSIDKVAKTALGATAFMALEAISAGVTLHYGFTNTVWAILSVGLVIFITGFPISYYAAKYGLDIDLLTRSAGFGYLGSTITSLIYASFTFIFFAIEAAILASALQALLGIPLAVGYIISAVAVIPIVTHGISAISRFQVGTQSFWLILQIAALLLVAGYEMDQVEDWTHYMPAGSNHNNTFDLALFGAAASVFLAFMAQIGEQVDYLRFMPEKTRKNRRQWWFWLILAGPGWIFIGIIKMLLGSFMAYIAISKNASFEQATDPTYMYQMAFNYLTQSPTFSLILAVFIVVVSQMKINVTNAYAGSIAWSNFFSRLTHSHPGRVVWLIFNVVIALLLMELGIYRALESILGIFSIIAISWLASLAADLMINKPLGISPNYGEFKRAHLYDVNPVGTVSMSIASVFGIICYLGHLGEIAGSLAHFISLGLCYILVPTIGWMTKGKYYLARQSPELEILNNNLQNTELQHIECCICETAFEIPDMSHCPAYQGPICSLCCSLDSRCHDLCKPEASISKQANNFFALFLPKKWLSYIDSSVGHFLGLFLAINFLTGMILSLIYYHMMPENAAQADLLQDTIWNLFFIMMIVVGVVSWIILLAKESRDVAQQESDRQTRRLIEEIDAHQITDQSLQDAKEIAENANSAKSRYLSGISHELRTPLQSILGYAQLLEQFDDAPQRHQKGLKIIRRNGEYLSDLIEGLLDISKIEAGRLDIYRNKIRLTELLDQLVDMFSPQAKAKGLTFIYNCLSTLPKVVVADEKRLRQILINLLSNAIKYTQQGQITFEVNYRNQVAEFTVSDTGVGIDPIDIERILDPFERIRNEKVPNITGTGLGLTIVKLLTEILGGELQIESTVNQGSCFKVSLFLSRVDTLQEPILKPLAINGYKGETITVVVVDDEPIHRGLISDLLVPLGFKTLEAKDAESCLKLIEHVQPDLFLLDVSMPGINGLELAHKLRTMNIKKPIIMISADVQERHNTGAEKTAHDDYMVKPISTQILLEKISVLLDIQWLYEDKSVSIVNDVIKTSSENSVIPIPTSVTEFFENTKSVAKFPDHGLIRELVSYAEIGFHKGVNNTLEKIAAIELISNSQLLVLKALAEKFQYEQMVKVLTLESHHE